MYLCKFDNGKRGETYIAAEYTDEQQKKMLADGYVSVSDEDYQYYIGNHGQGDNGTGYVRGADGKPTSAPAYVATPSEQANNLATAYTATVKDINSNIVLAMADGDTDTVAELKEDKATALAEYTKKLGAIK